MSLPRVSYLESWEQQPPSFLRQRAYREHDPLSSDDEETRSIPSIDHARLFSSSFSSSSGHLTVRHKLSFNPYSGRGWNQSSAADAEEERRSLLRSDVGETRDSFFETARPQPDLLPTEYVFQDPNWETVETTPAFEVGKAKRIAQVCAASVYCLFSAGVVFGFAAIKPVLIKDGVYRDQCTDEELKNGGIVCYGQEIRLNFMFTIAAVVTNICALPVGAILDYYGPRVCGVLGSISIATGAVLFAFAARLPFDGYIAGYSLLALGGPFIFISSFHLSNAFPPRSGLILSMLTGVFDASSALFLVFRILYEQTNGAFSVQRFFIVYLIVPILIFLIEIFLMPATSYKTVGELVLQAEENIVNEVNDIVDKSIPDPAERERQRHDRRIHRQSVVSEIQNLLDDSSHRVKTTDVNFDVNSPEFASHQLNQSIQKNNQINSKTKKSRVAGGLWGAMHGASALQQIRSPWFIFIALFTVIQMLRINYFVATILSQYDYLLSPELAQRLNHAFDLLLPLGGLLSIPFIGAILDTVPTLIVLLILVTVATVVGILGCIPNSMGAAYANIALFVLYRPFYYTAVSDYSAKVFGFQTFGKVYGLIIFLAGIGNFTQAGLDALTFKVFHRDPIPVDILLTVAAFLVGVTLVIFVSWKARTMACALAKTAALEGITGGYPEERVPFVHSENTNGNDRAYGSVS